MHVFLGKPFLYMSRERTIQLWRFRIGHDGKSSSLVLSGFPHSACLFYYDFGLVQNFLSSTLLEKIEVFALLQGEVIYT